MDKITVKFKKLRKDAKAPYSATGGSAGWDLCTLNYIEPARITTTIPELESIPFFYPAPMAPIVVHTGIAVEIPKGYVGILSLRSGISAKKFIRLANGVGVIDSDYRGEIKGVVSFTHDNNQEIDAGERIFQLVIYKLPEVEFVEAETLSDTGRGEGGYGSTGVK